MRTVHSKSNNTTTFFCIFRTNDADRFTESSMTRLLGHLRQILLALTDAAAPADPRVIHASVAAFINDLRMVTPDIALQRRAIFRAYAMLSSDDPATAKTNVWLNGTDTSSPFKRAANETVNIEIVSVIPQSPETWQVIWRELVYDRQGHPKEPPFIMRALLTIYSIDSTANTTEEQIRNNPLGIYVRDYSWAKQI